MLGDSRVLLASLLLFLIRHKHLVWAYMIVLIPGTIIIQGLKRLLELDRPAAVIDPSLFHIIGKTLEHNAFPSGHTATVMGFAAIVMASGLPRSLRYGILLLALLSGLSRIMVGAHWPLDVIAGIILGYLIGLAGVMLMRYCDRLLHSVWATRILWTLLATIAGSIYFQEKPDYPMVESFPMIWVTACLILSAIALVRSYKNSARNTRPETTA